MSADLVTAAQALLDELGDDRCRPGKFWCFVHDKAHNDEHFCTTGQAIDALRVAISSALPVTCTPVESVTAPAGEASGDAPPQAGPEWIPHPGVLCGYCGRQVRGSSAAADGTLVCHPDYPSSIEDDCYGMVTVHGRALQHIAATRNAKASGPAGGHVPPSID